MASFSRNRQDVKREGYKNPIRSLLRSPCEGNYNLYKVRGKKKKKKPGERREETGEENYFSPLPSLYAPFNKRRGGNGWRRPSSGGIPGLLWVRQTRTPPAHSALLVFRPFIKAANLRPAHNDGTSSPLRGPSR